jgi:hypothetical protein
LSRIQWGLQIQIKCWMFSFKGLKASPVGRTSFKEASK